jgi:non-specific serine/threonine protein kinase
MAETAPAIALFIERARQSQTHFTLTAANCADVIAICQKLDGLPLAIELAAARLAILSPGVLRARLDQRFRLLTGGPQDQPARLRSLSDAIDWSYSLLTEAEQTMLRVLAIFLGGWTISAAAEVAGLDDADAFDLIVSLDEKSLVRAMTATDDHAPRFTMLETIREYGLQLLQDREEIAAVRTAHAARFLELAEQAGPELDRANQGIWLDRLEIEHDNIRLALDWFRETHDADRGIRMASALFRFWDTRDYLSEGRQWIDVMLNLPGEVTETHAKAVALQALAELSLWQTDFAEADARYEEALLLFTALGDEAGRLRSLTGQTLAAISVRDLDRADQLLDKVEGAVQRTDDLIARASADYAIGVLHRVRGHLNDAEAFIQRAFAAREAAGDRSDAMNAVGDLAEIATLRGDYGTAAERWSDALERTYEFGERWCLAWYLEGMADLLVLTNRAEPACPLLGAAAQWRDTNNAPAMRLGGTEMRPFEMAKAELGDRLYDRLVNEGRALTLEAAIERAQAFTFDADPPPRLSPNRPDPMTRFGLTLREYDVFLMLCQRLTDKEIARSLFISPRTVGSHVNAILGKLGMTSRRDVPAMAAQLGVRSDSISG